jgi:hypothetical protein
MGEEADVAVEESDAEKSPHHASDEECAGKIHPTMRCSGAKDAVMAATPVRMYARAVRASPGV